MRNSVSDTAKYGDLTRGPRVIDDMVKGEMEEILAEVQDGSFAKEWILENMVGRPVFNALKRQDEGHLIEKVGTELRQMMPWLKSPAEMPAPKLVSVKQIAKEFGVSEHHVRRLVREGKISGSKVKGRVYVPADVEIPYRRTKGKWSKSWLRFRTVALPKSGFWRIWSVGLFLTP